AAAIVADGHAAVDVDGDGDLGGVAGHGFVDGVIDRFVDQVVQAFDAGIADVHAGPLADVFQVREVLHLVGAIFAIDAAGAEAFGDGAMLGAIAVCAVGGLLGIFGLGF